MIEQRLNDLIAESFRTNWDLPALTDYSTKETFSYRRLSEEVSHLHMMFRMLEIRQGDRIALVGKDYMRWASVFLATITYGAVIVPILKDFHTKDITNLIAHSQSKLLFINGSIWDSLQQEALTGMLKGVFSINRRKCLWSAQGERCDEVSSNLDRLWLEEHPAGLRPEDVQYRSLPNDTLAEINYTSGTSGFSKGVMLTHNNLAGQVTFALPTYLTGPSVRVMSFLPLAHAFGCAFDFLAQVCAGSHTTFLNRTPVPRVIMEAFQQVRPTTILTVPLIIEKLYHKKLASKANSSKFKTALRVPLVGWAIKKLICYRLKKAFGGEVIELIIGGAALNPEAENFLRMVGFPFTVGYGMTECGPLISYSPAGKYKPHSVGKVLGTMAVKIDPASSKVSNDGHSVGEILVKGEHVMRGYYNNPEATQKAIDADGWLHTGDLGYVDADGFIFIKGRLKNMLLGASGQNIYPEEIEGRLSNLSFVSECLVVQRGQLIVALVYPDYTALEKKHLQVSDLEKIMEDNRALLNKSLPAYSQVARIDIMREEFEKTPKKSIKRFLYESEN